MMINRQSRLTVLIMLLLAGCISLFSQAPQKMSYQGLLTNSDGTPVADGSYNLIFLLYDAPQNGTVAWQESQPVSIENGILNVMLGEFVPLSAPFDRPYWLGIRVGNDPELTPRIELAAGGYSFHAVSVSDSSISSAKIAAGTVVRSINGKTEAVQLQAGANIAINESGNTLTIEAVGVNAGVQSVQSSDNTLSISNPNGPTTDIGVAAGGIATAQLADAAVTQAKLDPNVSLPISGAAGGDLSGNYPDPTVNGLLGRPLSANPPSTNQVLKWNGSNWAPATDAVGSNIWSTSGNDAYYNSGDVGIGTSSIDAKFEIFQNSSLADPHILLHENGNDYARLNFKNNNGSNYWSIAAYIASNNRNDRLNFWNGTSGDVMTITGDGEVGIDVGISPKVKFHIGNNNKVLFGTDTLGSGTKLLFLPHRQAFRVGTLDAGAPSTYWNFDSLGQNSFASGQNTRATGFASTAMGRNTDARGSYSFAGNYFTNAFGIYSAALGFASTSSGSAAMALGYDTDAPGHRSAALNDRTIAQAFASTAIGRYNIGFGNPTGWAVTDPIFEIGIGSSDVNRANALTVLKNGNVGIGVTFPNDPLEIRGRFQFGSAEFIEDGGINTITVGGSILPNNDNIRDLGAATFRWDDVWATNGIIQTSDARLKRNVQNLNYGLDEVLQLRPVSYQWRDGFDSGTKLGLIAQEVQQVLDGVVKTHDYQTSEDDPTQADRVAVEQLGMNYAALVPVLIKAIQQQQARIDQLEQRLESLEK